MSLDVIDAPRGLRRKDDARPTIAQPVPPIHMGPAPVADWLPSTRYCDQPTSLRTRLAGISGVSMVAAIFIAGMVLTWTGYKAAKAPPTLIVFNVAPPAAPPEPVSEVPPGPQQEQKEKPQPEPDQPKIEPPEIQLPSNNPIPLTRTKAVVDPGPPVDRTTAPPSRPLPPAQAQSDAKPTWEGLVLGALNKVKRYPRDAAFRHQQGVPFIRFVMNRQGKVLSVRLERSSGFRGLDDEAVSLPKRAQPLPKPPEDVTGETIELVVPVEFFMR